MVSRMADYTLPVLKRTLEIIHERGWTKHFSTYSLCNGGPLNIRTAVQLAQHELHPGERSVQIGVLQTLTMHLEGIMDWEAGVRSTGRPRTHDEVVRKLTDIIKKVETDGPQTLTGKRSSRTGFGAQPAGKRNA